MSRPEVSIVVPVYDEEGSIEPLLDELDRVLSAAPFTWEVIAVDDGSRDRSRAILAEERKRRPWLRLVVLERNMGQTAALEAGWKAARGRYLAAMDADLQNDPADIPRLYEMLERGGSGCDMAIGVRVNRRDTAWKRFQSRIGNRVRDWITGDRISDTGCSLKMMRRECFEGLTLFNGMHRFLPTLVRMRGWSVSELPVNHRERRWGETKYGAANRAWRGLVDCLAVRWMRRRMLRYEAKEENE
jgi:dolichol-phosphate mannosyltransferase